LKIQPQIVKSSNLQILKSSNPQIFKLSNLQIFKSKILIHSPANITKQLETDLKKHNQQYTPIELKHFNKAHDRFLIIDQKDVYHIGASLKDLGKKWFAFSKINLNAIELTDKLI